MRFYLSQYYLIFKSEREDCNMYTTSHPLHRHRERFTMKHHATAGHPTPNLSQIYLSISYEPYHTPPFINRIESIC